MKRMLLYLLLLLPVAGCGNVYLRGDALTAAETSAMDAYGALQRATPAPEPLQTAVEPWLRAYLAENFKQWRFFVRSARKDVNWGPTLEGE